MKQLFTSLALLGFLCFSLPIEAAPVYGPIIYCPITENHYQRVDFPGESTWESEWTASKNHAEQMSYVGVFGHMATITSQEENWWIVDNLGGALTLDHWLGGYREAAGGWQWITGEPWVYTNWFPGEPNSETDNAPYALQFDDAETASPVPGYWNDISPSTFEDGFIVEYETKPVPEPSTILLIASGLIGFAGFRRKFRNL